MKLSVNYSDTLLALLKEDPKLPIDYIKVPMGSFPGCFEQYLVGKQLRPLISHIGQAGVLDILNIDESRRLNIQTLDKIIDLSDSSKLSTHVNGHISYFPEFVDCQHSFKVTLANAIKQRFLDTVETYKQHYQQIFSIENWPYYSFANDFRICSEPEFISELCEISGCGFLLDISHARVTAHFLEIDILKYLDMCPIDKLTEIHFSGSSIYRDKDFIWDSHSEFDNYDLELLDYVLNKSKPEVITIEYGGLPNYQKDLEGGYIFLDRNNPKKLLDMINCLGVK
jgi:uncharacterized protein